MAEKVQQHITPLQRLLLEHMEATGESLSGIARRAGMPRQTVQAVLYRPGHSVPLESTMAKLAKGLGISVETVRQAAAQGLAAPNSNQAQGATVRKLAEDPVLMVLMDEASELTPEQRQVLVETAKALRRLAIQQGPSTKASRRASR
jgi:lambda repressor-like predicted transcriptional regulator